MGSNKAFLLFGFSVAMVLLINLEVAATRKLAETRIENADEAATETKDVNFKDAKFFGYGGYEGGGGGGGGYDGFGRYPGYHGEPRYRSYPWRDSYGWYRGGYRDYPFPGGP